jgi:molybdopterin-guanine dinucleotide biosynthesis protein A
MDSIEGFILAGGQSRRMGTDKARLTLSGESFVERIAQALAPVTTSQRIVGGSHDANTAGLEIVPDRVAAWGALGGVHAALSVCLAPWALIVACDFPFVTSELFSRLSAARANFEAVAPIQRDEIPQPLCALYRVEPCSRLAEQFINSGERKPVALLQSVNTRWVPFAELSDLNGSNHFFDNINTPQDYEQARERI